MPKDKSKADDETKKKNRKYWNELQLEQLIEDDEKKNKKKKKK